MGGIQLDPRFPGILDPMPLVGGGGGDNTDAMFDNREKLEILGIFGLWRPHTLMIPWDPGSKYAQIFQPCQITRSFIGHRSVNFPSMLQSVITTVMLLHIHIHRCRTSDIKSGGADGGGGGAKSTTRVDWIVM